MRSRSTDMAITPPFFEFGSEEEEDWVWLFDKKPYIQQEPPEFEEGPDAYFDSAGRVAELGVENYAVVIKRWSEQPDLPAFDRHLRRVAALYLGGEDVSSLNTFALRDRLEPAVRQRQRESAFPAHLWRSARWLWARISHRSS